jgi:hypothetical protein
MSFSNVNHKSQNSQSLMACKGPSQLRLICILAIKLGMVSNHGPTHLRHSAQHYYDSAVVMKNGNSGLSGMEGVDLVSASLSCI